MLVLFKSAYWVGYLRNVLLPPKRVPSVGVVLFVDACGTS